jgi:hypothetical protein
MIKNNDRINFNELFRLVNKESDGIARTTLRKVIDDLIEQKKIAEIHVGERKLFTSNTAIIKYERNQLKKFNKLLSAHEKRLKKLEKIIDTLDRSDLLFMLSRFVRMIWPLDLMFYEIYSTYHEKDFEGYFKRLDQLKRDFFEIVFDVTFLEKGMLREFEDLVFSYSNDAEVDFDADLESF